MKMKNLVCREVFILIIILLLGGTLRFYKIGKVPTGFLNDEAAIGYNAYSLLKTGKDEFGNSFPILFRSFGEGKLPIQIYLTIPSIAILGLTETAVRLPVAIASTLTIFVFYYLVYQAMEFYQAKNSKAIALLSALGAAISPWHLHFSRAAFEVITASLFFLTGSIFWLEFLKGKKISRIFLSSLFFSLSILTYNSFRILTPLFVLFLFIFFSKKESTFKKIALPFTILIIISEVILLNNYGLSRAQGISIFNKQSGVEGKILQELTEHKQNLIVSRIFHNKLIGYSKDYLQRFMSHFNWDLLFFTGDPLRVRYKIPEHGLFYLYSLPFILVGLYQSLRKNYWIFIFLMIVSPVAASLTFETPSTIRTLPLVFPLIFFEALGIYTSWKGLPKRLRNIFIGLIFMIIGFFISNYLDSYYIHFPQRQSYFWQDGYKELVQKIKELEGSYKRIDVTDSRGTPYIFFLFYNKYDPPKWQAQVQEAVEPAKAFNFIAIRKMDKLRFINNTCPAQKPEDDVLYVCTEENHPETLIKKGMVRIIKSIPYSDGQPAFVLMEKVKGTIIPENISEEI